MWILLTFGPIAIITISVVLFAFINERKSEKRKYKIFFDDLRTIDMVYGPGRDSEFEVVRTVDDFKALIEKRGIPIFVSFDHDLGLGKDGIPEDVYEVVKWMVFEKEFDLRNMEFSIHSGNPVGADKIRSLIKNWNKELIRRDEQKNKR